MTPPVFVPDAPVAVTPVGDTPELTQTDVEATQATNSLQGTVVWEDGKCCIGGIAGDTIQARVTFTATSPFGGVDEMRVAVGGMCYEEGRLTDTTWKPYITSAVYPITVALNWAGYYVSVQYRDEHGNLSPVYCDDISVEGLPPIIPSSKP